MPFTWLHQLVTTGWAVAITFEDGWYTVWIKRAGDHYYFTNLNLFSALLRAWQKPVE